MTNTRRRRESTKYQLQRLNVLLRFARVDPWKLDNGALGKLLDEMYFAVVGGDPRSEAARDLLRPRFDRHATREALSEAQRGLDRALQVLVKSTTTGPRQVELKLAGLEFGI